MSRKKSHKTAKNTGLTVSSVSVSASALHAFLGADLASQAMLLAAALLAFALWLAIKPRG